MKVIVEHEDKASRYLVQYANKIECLGRFHKIIDIEESHLAWLRELAACIEPNFTIVLGKEQNTEDMLLGESNKLIALLGARQANLLIDTYYNMITHVSKHILKGETVNQCEYVSCYSDTHEITAADYIKCMYYLTNLSRERNKRLLIYANIYVPDEAYRHQALTYRIINSCLEAVNGRLILESLGTESTDFPRQNNMLFDDVFYSTIDPNEKIYMLTRFATLNTPEYFESLGFKAVRLVGNYSMLYGTRAQYDRYREVLKPDVASAYPLNMVSHVSCSKQSVKKESPYSLVEKNLKYKGNGVYIGIITVDDVDYTNSVLRRKDGASRIACIWQQTSADDGLYYYNEQINAALASNNPGSIISLPEGESISTMMLSIAGGMSEENGYRGIASEAEFVVVRLKTASEHLQRIYGGIPNQYTITLPDELIGLRKLIGFASQQGKPLVLCMPFNGNLNAHDGQLFIHKIIEEMARTPSVTIVVPAGEEADKRHHYAIEGAQNTFGPVMLNITKDNQNIVGNIYHKLANVVSSNLYGPPGIMNGPVDLRKKAVTRTRDTIIYSNGQEYDFLNGAQKIAFRIENPQIGEWRIQETLEAPINSKADLWIAQEPLNPSITLTPSQTNTTIGGGACIQNIMSVGAYNKKTMTVLGSSGRGYTWDDRVAPLFVTHASEIIAACGQGEWVSATGTLPAAGIMLGAAASLYSKLLAERITPLANTLVMNSAVLNLLTQQEGVEYPNPNQGYGIFDVNRLE